MYKAIFVPTICIDIHTCIYILKFTYIYIYINIFTHTYLYTYMCTFVNMYIYICIHGSPALYRAIIVPIVFDTFAVGAARRAFMCSCRIVCSLHVLRLECIIYVMYVWCTYIFDLCICHTYMYAIYISGVNLCVAAASFARSMSSA